jgi:protein-L-isoaspartate O-methyltransferase
MEDMAHTDQPLKEGNVHLSAPHIYGSVLEAFELEQDSSLSFLNIGSGSGYLSCIVAEILGPKSVNDGTPWSAIAHSLDS